MPRLRAPAYAERPPGGPELKLRHDETAPGCIDASVSGALEVDSCTCLQNFWELRLAGARELRLDLAGVEQVDAGGLAALVALIAEQLGQGGRVALRGAPERVRAALEAAGLAASAGLQLES